MSRQTEFPSPLNTGTTHNQTSIKRFEKSLNKAGYRKEFIAHINKTHEQNIRDLLDTHRSYFDHIFSNTNDIILPEYETLVEEILKDLNHIDTRNKEREEISMLHEFITYWQQKLDEARKKEHDAKDEKELKVIMQPDEDLP